ncbi:hypothetical protein VTP01DRAFT_7037 [Rhizomucor pusillus]|uniref:uncharacterized protein n=1 Tax=Rhizomucor pusillus TaxID=4840 RepID=UPI0037422115
MEKATIGYTNDTTRPAPRKLSLTDKEKHPHLHQVHEVLHNIKHDIKNHVSHRHDESHFEKRPQDGKTNPME